MKPTAKRIQCAAFWCGAIRGLLSCAVAGLSLGAAEQSVSPNPEQPQANACPEGVAAGSRCLSGRDSAGAYYWLAVPPGWKDGTLVVHAHGGPELGEPRAARAAADLTRWSIWTRAGYAYAGSGFRQGGVAVRSAAEDTERVRQLFVAHIGMPKRTILHGQSWGAGVAVKAAEMAAHAGKGPAPYDAVLLTSGVLGGGTQSYNFRLDLRAVYQALCANHPKPDEPAYPLWQGLPLDSTLTRAELAARIDACTGVRHKPEQRTASQRENLKTITRVIAIPEASLLGHLNWATWHFQDIAFKRLAGRSAFGNQGVRYRGSPDDEGLNRAVPRYDADPEARAVLALDTDLQGRIELPVLTVHAVNDSVAFVELESFFREKMGSFGSTDRLVQVFTDDSEHSYLSDAQYVAAMGSLMNWVERGEKPTPQSVADRCPRLDAAFDPAKGCRFLPAFQPRTLESRVPVR